MDWPLHVTLTVPHGPDSPTARLRRILRAFGKLRRKKLWTDRTRGGIRGLEIDSKSGEFHEHLHCVIDCKWLAHFTPPPQRGDSKKRLKAKFKAASDELGLAWARCLGIKSMDPDWCGVIFKVRRCDRETIAREVLKYAVKGSMLIDYRHPIGDVIRGLQSCRATQSFGTLFGPKRLQDPAKPKAPECKKCGSSEWMIDEVIESTMRTSRETRRRR